jgi:multiple sugar transport system permease protein
MSMPGKKASLTGMRRREELTAWLFISPIVLGILIFQLYPTLFSLYISFTQWNLLSWPPKWIGVANYVTLFTTDRFFAKTMANTATYAGWTVVAGLALGLFFAVLLNQEIRGKYLYRAIYFVPVVAPTVAVALLWQILYDPNFGVFNGLLRMIGVHGPNWLGNTTWAMRSIIFEAIWAGLGFTILIFLAGLQGISQEYYEAAEIDGANAVQKFFFITMPLLSPTTFFLLVTGVIGSFQVFDIPFVMTGGGPANATQMVVMYLYNNAFTIQKMGLASAVAFMVFVVIIILTFLNFRISKRWVFYE